jgi:hypothetical protein
MEVKWRDTWKEAFLKEASEELENFFKVFEKIDLDFRERLVYLALIHLSANKASNPEISPYFKVSLDQLMNLLRITEREIEEALVILERKRMVFIPDGFETEGGLFIAVNYDPLLIIKELLYLEESSKEIDGYSNFEF